MLKKLGRCFNPWVRAFVESSCPLCDRSTSQDFCLDCDRQLQRCQVCPPSWNSSANPPVFPWGIYKGALKRAIAALKYDKQVYLANSLGAWMAQAWNETVSESIEHAIVVPIPMHESKKKQRGFNQTDLIAQRFCRSTRLALELNGLQRIRTTEAQFQLSVQEREQNLKDAFQVNNSRLKHWKAKPVLLLDDIYTTGATARSATKALQESGVCVMGIVVLAMAERG